MSDQTAAAAPPPAHCLEQPPPGAWRRQSDPEWARHPHICPTPLAPACPHFFHPQAMLSCYVGNLDPRVSFLTRDRRNLPSHAQLQAGAEGGVGVGVGGWGDDGLAPRAVRCQWRCAHRSAGRHTAVTLNGRPRGLHGDSGRGGSASGRKGICDAGSQHEKSFRPRPIISSLSHHKLAQQYLFADITPLFLSQHIAVISPLFHYYFTMISPVFSISPLLFHKYLIVVSPLFQHYLAIISPSSRCNIALP